MKDYTFSVSTNEMKRYAYLDYARVIVAFFVIFGHLIPDSDMCIRPYIYAFHMPFFFIVSGILHKNMGYIPMEKYLRTLILPFLLFNLLFFILRPLLGGVIMYPIFQDSHDIVTVYLSYLKKVISDFLCGSYVPDGPTWFLIPLFYCKVLTDLSINRIYIILIMVVALVTITYYDFRYLRVGCGIMVFPFYYFGYYLKCRNIIPRILNHISCHQIKYVMLSLLLITISLYFTMLNVKVSTFSVNFGSFPIYPLNVVLFYANAFFMSWGILILCTLFRHNSLIEKIAKALISILCVQAFFCYIFIYFANRNNVLLCFMTSFLIMWGCIKIHHFLERYCPLLIGKLNKQ